MALGKFHPVTVPVWGEIGITARMFRERLPSTIAAIDQRPELAERWQIWRAEKDSRLREERGLGISSVAVFAALGCCIPGDAVIAVDVGNNTYSFGRYFEPDRQRWAPGQQRRTSRPIAAARLSRSAATAASTSTWASSRPP